MCSHCKLRSACASVQSDQSSMGTLWVAKGPRFLQAKKTKALRIMVSTVSLRNSNLCFVWFEVYIPVNSYGHVETVSSPNCTFSWLSLTKLFTSTLCTYFDCN